MTQTLTGEVERVTFENDETSFRVVRLGALEGDLRRAQVTLVGTFPPVGPGERVRVTGKFFMDPRRGEQFRVESLIALQPDTLKGLERYLGSGVVPGVGPGFAKRIVERFGMQSLEVLDNAPSKLSQVRGLGKKRAQEIALAWSEQRAVTNIMLILQTHGASARLALSIVKHYGDEAAKIVQTSPHRLAMDVRGVGFKTADRIAASLGIAKDHPERLQAGTMHQLRASADRGHVFSERAQLRVSVQEMLGVGEELVDVAIDKLWAGGRIVVEEERVFLAALHLAERATAQQVERLLTAPGKVLSSVEFAVRTFEEAQGLSLAPLQRQAVTLASHHKLCVITGGPGVGKTTIIRALVSMFDGAKLRIGLAAPTGRAAKRLSEATGREALTIHRLLEYEPRSQSFQRDSDSPVAVDALVVDEASMLDVQLGSALLDAVPTHARIVMVGDSDQLPPVGPGALLRDLLQSERVPFVRLDEIFRQVGQSRIVESAHRILQGQLPEGGEREDPNADFFMIPRREQEEAAELVEELVARRIPKRFGHDPHKDIFVLTPMHRGAAGTIELNRRLQQVLNPPPDEGSEVLPVRAGDRVMQTKNDYEKEVFNGDLGTVVSADGEEHRLVVRFDDREVIYEDAEREALVLAYATSVHKSQGSEYPVVVIVLLTSHFVMLSRNLLYTAVTRARKLCVLISDKKALSLALAETRREHRHTWLSERLRQALPRC